MDEVLLNTIYTMCRSLNSGTLEIRKSSLRGGGIKIDTLPDKKNETCTFQKG